MLINMELHLATSMAQSLTFWATDCSQKRSRGVDSHEGVAEGRSRAGGGPEQWWSHFGDGDGSSKREEESEQRATESGADGGQLGRTERSRGCVTPAAPQRRGVGAGGEGAARILAA